jgi:hypothetical protein
VGPVTKSRLARSTDFADNPDMAAAFGTTRKLMSISRGEFEASARALDRTVALDASSGGVIARYARGTGGAAIVRYTPLPPRTIGGGLLTLPQADVTLTFEGLSEAEQRAFQLSFETSFQRGGG